ncbi:MAG: Imm49 family immunity protein [Bryobacteraceae bacterium]
MTQQRDACAAGLDWPGRLEFQNRLRDAVLSRGPFGEDGRDLAKADFARIALMTVLPGHESECGAAVCEAAAAGAAATLSHVMKNGRVAMEWPEGSVRRMPTGAAALDPACWLRSVACALVARDEDAVAVLCEPAHIAAAQLPAKLADDFWPFLCAAVAAVVRDPGSAAAWLDDAERLMAPGRIKNADPPTVALEFQPLAAMVRALAQPDGDFDSALTHALEAYRELFSRREPSADPAQLLQLEALGLAALAFDRRRPFDPSGLPLPLVKGEFPRQPVHVTFEYMPRRAERIADPTRFLDLEGFPRPGRKHSVVERGGALLAVYTVAGRAGCPRARATFVLEGGDPATPRALDAGDLILLGDFYAQQAESPLAAGDAKAAAGWLSQAVESMDAVLATIVPPADAVPDSEFFTERGRLARDAEPGRFRRERLAAYRAALNERRESLCRPAGESVARSFALLTADALAEQVRPLLSALAKDRSGAILKRLRPRPEDYAKVFQPAAVGRARQLYENLWNAGVEMSFPPSTQSELRIVVAPAGMLASTNDLSRHFPGGYAAIARQLQPHSVWAAWRFVEPGADSGLAFDGLVWCDDHWAWFPKPYRFLANTAETAH